MPDEHHSKQSVGLIVPGLAGRCPRCGKGKLFDGFLALKPECENCGLDYAFADSGDGPAVFVMFAVGFLVIALVLWTEITYSPPLWVHALIWVPVTIALSLGALRAFKGVLIGLQYRHSAAEGVIDRSDDA
ncbi:DUF983 domain-containing protein [Martelella radicis]|uniref:Uncharacterized protein (DUF983 family) n=1 Tax=Martelella radicis TaxID=1397476 RepID=A0A7W6KJC1_9HYPH|nr:DUF983 domain-containing protein [Martelella radicis]MBB4122218.1 uncharacterized protein (DUF983 family) [Martelella radicis]